MEDVCDHFAAKITTMSDKLTLQWATRFYYICSLYFTVCVSSVQSFRRPPEVSS